MALKGMLVKLAGVLILVICGTKTDVDGAPTDKMDVDFTSATELSRTKRALDWRSLISVVACGPLPSTYNGHRGSDALILAFSLRDELKAWSTSVDWLVFATDAENGWSYHRSGSWEEEVKTDLCGFDVLVFKRPTKLSCSSRIENDAYKLLRDAARESRTFSGARDVITGRDHQYNIETDLAIAYEFGFFSSYIDEDCTSYSHPDPQEIASFMVGSRT